MTYDNTNRGQIWGNDKKETDKHPDFKGSIDVEGVEYWLSGWKRQPGDNPKSPAVRFSIQKKESQQPNDRDEPRAGSTTPAPSDDGFDDIPF